MVVVLILYAVILPSEGARENPNERVRFFPVDSRLICILL